MDLLNNNQEKPKPTKGKKIILILLIVSILLAIAITIIIIYIEINKTQGNTLYINEEKKDISAELIIKDTNGNQYISLKELADFFSYEYDNSEYQKYGVDTTKCYIKNEKLISGFELSSKKIYKYEEQTDLDYQYYNLNNEIITYNNKLYIALADLTQALNLTCTIDENNNIKINSIEHLAKIYQERLKDTGYTVTTEQNNQKALSYGWIIVSKNGLWSVLNTQLEEIIGAKYINIYFDEFNLNYIVSNSNGLYGIITNNGLIEQSLKYDEIKILNYENMIYKIKNNNKYGIMKKDGTMLADIVYDEIGYQADLGNKILYTLIIPNLDGKIGETIVVKQNDKYGLITLLAGETYLPCDHLEKLYSVNQLGEIEYRVEADKQTLGLLDYLILRKTEKINLN